MRNETNIPVSVLDFSRMEGLVVDCLKNAGRWDEGEKVSIGYEYGMVEKDGKHYILCSEGVGSSVAIEDCPYEIDWYVNGEKDGVKFIGLAPLVTSKISIEDLDAPEGFTIKDVTTLAKFIRVFGRRLEENYWTWVSFLSKKG